MEVFSKELRATDVGVKLSFPTHGLEHLDFAGSNSVDLRVKDSCGELRVIRCWKRKNGDHDKRCFLAAGSNLLLIMDWELVTRLFFSARMTIAWGHSSGSKLGGKSCCLVERLGVKCQELLSSSYSHGERERERERESFNAHQINQGQAEQSPWTAGCGRNNMKNSEK
uniref:Uncharacterized protein n=1 Tax=Salix viminalis TaxID=40686 RepID=A0A6N2K9L6_SALVM